ncbi:sulfite oxidase s [Fusarium sp. NRRL 52700]|nr:sulfite oxidase s [Fusarium sp. NRRL 52700]
MISVVMKPMDQTVSHVPKAGAEREACIRIEPEGFFLRPPPTPRHLSSFITPDDQLFQTIHMGAAVVNEAKWLLVIDGLVRKPFALSLAQLKALPQTSVTSFHECYGSPLKPPTSNPWRIGNVVWTGVQLSTILALGGPLPEANFVWSEGLDHGKFFEYEADRYQKDLPVTKAQRPEVLLAWEINGEPLCKERGGPVRLVVPGWFGTNSTKWICRLSLQGSRAPGPFASVLYNEKDPSNAEGFRMRPVWEVEVNSMITKPADLEVICAGLVTVEGWSWSHDGVALVEISKDEGKSWVRGKVDGKEDQAWQKFTAAIELEPGVWKLIARATSERLPHSPKDTDISSSVISSSTSRYPQALSIMAPFEPKYNNEVQQMMFVAGETQDIANETAALVEQIVREQIIHLLTKAKELSARRGDKFIAVKDILFQVRHDTARMTRLQNVIRWKKLRGEARKTASDKDKPENDAEDSFSDTDNAAEDIAKKTTEASAALMPWDEEFMFAVRPPGGDADAVQISEQSRERLIWADEVTSKMSGEEYTKWCSYRKASFHRAKEARFREWACIGVVADLRKKDEAIEILSSIAVEMVKRLTDMALSIQAQEITTQGGKEHEAAAAALQARRQGLFLMSNPQRPAIDARHIRKAFEMTQSQPKIRGYQLNRRVGPKPLQLI